MWDIMTQCGKSPYFVPKIHLDEKLGCPPTHAPSENTEGDVIAKYQSHFIIPTFHSEQKFAFTENQFVSQKLKKSLFSDKIKPRYP